jgi:short-subunit dehydrogenase
LVDRRQVQLEEVCESLAAQYGVSAIPAVVDLCKRKQVERLAKRLEQLADVELLVNNAGFGTADYFVDTDASHLVSMVDVHVVAPTLLTQAVLPAMIDRNRGGIINVSSLSSWFYSAGNVLYGSTKNYLAVFSQSLHQELRGTNVCIQALCPGFIRTGFHAAESMRAFKLRRPPSARLWMSADDVADYSLRKLNGKRVIVIPGFGYRVLGRLAQMPLLQPIMQRIMRAPRSVPSTVPKVQPCPAPLFGELKKA